MDENTLTTWNAETLIADSRSSADSLPFEKSRVFCPERSNCTVQIMVHARTIAKYVLNSSSWWNSNLPWKRSFIISMKFVALRNIPAVAIHCSAGFVL